jgi:hypothetical protein
MSATIPVSSRVAEALRQSAHPALRRLAVEETETAVVINGQVSSYYLKQLAQETIMPLRGQRNVVNQVAVEQDGRSGLDF